MKIESSKTNVGWCRATLNGCTGIGPNWLNALNDLAKHLPKHDKEALAIVRTEWRAEYKRLLYDIIAPALFELHKQWLKTHVNATAIADLEQLLANFKFLNRRMR